MQKLMKLSPVLLIALYLFYPLSLLLPCEFVISNPVGYAILTLLLCAALNCLAARRVFGRVGERLIALGLPLSILNVILLALLESGMTAALLLLSCLFALLLFLRHNQSSLTRKLSGIAASLLLIPALLLCLASLTFGSIGSTQTVRVIPSPDARRHADVLSVDQGALGGDTVVTVQRYGQIPLLFASLQPPIQRLYYGDWGEEDSLEVQWLDNETLSIDGIDYPL